MSIEMSAPFFITVYGLVCVLAAALAFVIASAKHRDAGFWAVIAFLFPPAVVVTVFLTPATRTERERKEIEKMLHREMHRMED